MPSIRSTLLALVAVAASACGGSTPAGPQGAEPALAALSLLDASVEVRLGDDEAFAGASDSQALAIDDDVRTDGTGFAQVDYLDGSLTRLGPDSVLRIAELAGSREAADVVVRLDVGRSWHAVTDRTASDGRFEVETAVGTAAVRGTVFTVDCDTDLGPCTFAVLEGVVEVTTVAGEVVELGPGESITVGPDGATALADDDPDRTAFITRNAGLDDVALDGMPPGLGGPPAALPREPGGPGGYTLTGTRLQSCGQTQEIVSWELPATVPAGTTEVAVEFSQQFVNPCEGQGLNVVLRLFPVGDHPTMDDVAVLLGCQGQACPDLEPRRTAVVEVADTAGTAVLSFAPGLEPGGYWTLVEIGTFAFRDGPDDVSDVVLPILLVE